MAEHEPQRSDAAGGRPERDSLIREIDAFVERVRSGAYVDGWGWDEGIHDERYFGDESWVDEMDDLFAAASSAFVDGDMELAREALGSLLTAFELEDEGETFCGPEPPDAMVSTDIDEVTVRYLRAVYETTPPSNRPDTLWDAMLSLRYGGDQPTLRAVSETRRGPLPELHEFLPAWLAHLHVIDEASGPVSPGTGRTVARLLSEAAELHSGVDALGDLARARGVRDPGAYQDWVRALMRSGRHQDAGLAAREALASIEPRGRIRASIAETLARLSAAAGDPEAALDARRERWRSFPSTSGLLALIDIATALDRAQEVLTVESAWARALGPLSADRPNIDGDQLLCLLLVLAGRIEEAVEILAAAEPLGWSGGCHPGPLVVPFLLIAATGPEIRPDLLIDPGSTSPPKEPVLLLAQELGHFDQIASAGSLDGLTYPDDEGDAAGEVSIGDRLSGIPAEKLVPSYLLRLALTDLSTTRSQRERWLTVATGVVEDRIAAIVTAKHRRAYERAARLAVACGESIALAHDERDAAVFVGAIRSRFPRHYAFRDELDRATRPSPLLPCPPKRRR